MKKINRLLLFLICVFLLAACNGPDDNTVSSSFTENLSYTAKTQLECFQNGYFERSNVIIYYNTKDGRIDVTNDVETQFILDTSVVGNAECKVIYKNLYVTFKVLIVMPKLSGLTIYMNDEQEDYIIGQSLRLNNYYVYFSYNNNTTMPATNVRWTLYDPDGNPVDVYGKFKRVGVYKYVATYTNGDGSFEDYKLIYVNYDTNDKKTFDDFSKNHEMANGRYLVDDMIKFDENDVYTISFGGIRTYIEEKNENGTSVEDLTNNVFSSRLTLGAINSTFEIKLREKKTFQIICSTSDERNLYIVGNNFKQLMEEINVPESEFSQYIITLEPGEYYLTSENSRLSIYQYIFYSE